MLIEPFAEPLVARSTAESGAGRVAIAKQLQTGSITNKKALCRAIGHGTRVAIAKQQQWAQLKQKEGPLQSQRSRNAGGDCEATTMGSITNKKDHC